MSTAQQTPILNHSYQNATSKNQKRRIFAPCITIKDDKTGAFQPKEPLPFKARVPISETSHPLLYFATKKWLCLMSEDNGKTYGRALGEAAQQGFLFVEEGLILSQLFALDEHGSSIFFDELPPSAKGGGWFHGMTQNMLSSPGYLPSLFEAALKTREEQLGRKIKPEKQEKDPLLISFRSASLTRSGSIPDHFFGKILGSAGVVLAVVEEKRTYPGGLKDLVSILAKWKKINVFMSGDKPPNAEHAMKHNVWVGSPQAGSWWGRIFWQLFAEYNSMNCRHWVLTDRYYSVFGSCEDDGVITIIHIFTHVSSDADHIETPLEEYARAGTQPNGVKNVQVPPVGPKSSYGRLHTRMNIMEAYCKIMHYAARYRAPGPGHTPRLPTS
ncbi:hypothetical protein L486_03545 [Kwoniella mangroviensis CBS 10435]|uniref:Uncharacterized protein n=1 Tax=Kwoniella mangroviensis CBS 10435 TaxID=1331196 RepID=A0A1B9IU58_9TREE|nr:hypothetical protein L486_03545 [Kwoniella mangroviensis CBS 10435]